ncbi:hypothetical protein OHC33_009254 [Knufia fluminis]|uniref:Cytochrome P450 n=1 Tax=Knufia fluminis TaxID=191047 RepID=A0AAN8IJ14_9EURO|nr:hypothetical protein OHC33_009254 [Knufia fluminis]
MLALVVLCLLVLGGVLVHPILDYLLDRKSLRQFPSPSVAAFTPFWVIYENWKGRRFLAVAQAHKELGPVIRITPNSLSFSDPKAYKDIYGHGSSILKDVFYDNVAGSTPSMADTTSRALHSIKRKNLSSIFSAKNITAMEPKVMLSVRKLLDALKHKSEGRRMADTDQFPVSNRRFDLRPWLNMFSFDAISDMLWSSRYGFLDRGNDDCHSMAEDGTTITVHAMNSFQTGVHFNTLCAQLSPIAYRLSRFVSQPTFLKQAADHFTGMARYQTVKRLASAPSEPDFFSFLPLESTEKRPVAMGLPDLVAECTSFLNAGNDTTQISLTNAMYELASHPEKQRKLYNSLVESLEEGSRPIASYDELSKIPYLRACLDETFRLLPPVRFGLPRRTIGQGATIAGHHIPAGVTVSSSVHSLHRDESLFHKAHEWIPERWTPENPDLLPGEWQNLKDFVLPFTLGGRACIGRNLAYMELSICLAALVMAFEWKIDAQHEREFVHFERFNSSAVRLIVSARTRPEVRDVSVE